MELTNKKLEQFLIDNNALDAYLRNCAKARHLEKNINAIGLAFSWSNTPEGSIYWNNLDDLYHSYEYNIKCQQSDLVNHPPHYQGDKFECIDVIAEVTKDLKGIESVCTANAIKYLWRWKKKNGKQDIEKAIWYLNHLLKNID